MTTTTETETRKHVHRPAPALTEVRPYHAWAPDAHRAQGNVTYTERCACGAARYVNCNRGETQTGPWRE